MPYTLTFDGNFFHIADFIKGLDSLVKTEERKGRRRRPPDHRRRLLARPRIRNRASRALEATLLGHHLPDAARTGRHRRRHADRPGAGDGHAGLDHDRRRRHEAAEDGPELKMPELKVPPFLSDLYYDLRDRRLLPLVGAGRSSRSSRCRSCSAAARRSRSRRPGLGRRSPRPRGADGRRSSPSSRRRPGLRDYRKRLDGRTPTDPFKQRFTGAGPRRAPNSAERRKTSNRRARDDLDHRNHRRADGSGGDPDAGRGRRRRARAGARLRASSPVAERRREPGQAAA